MKYSAVLFLFLIVCTQSCKKTGADVDLVQVTQLTVWNKALHNAFTDLIHFDGNYYCVFREASGHDTYDGKLRVVRSADGVKWDSFAYLGVPDKDLRDPHFFVDGNNLLSVATHGRDRNEDGQNIVFKLKNGQFTQEESVNVDNDYWLWSYSKFKDSLYSVGYNLKQICFSRFNSQKSKIMLFKNTDSACISFGTVAVSNWVNNNFQCPNESSMIFTSDSMLVTIVRDEHNEGKSHIGISKFPFKEWRWQEFPYFIRGPKLALLPDGRFFLCAASLISLDKTYYAIINPHDFSIEKIRVFPSGGDTGYPGVIIEGNTALISYYSSHEGNSRVYIQRIAY
jgi:hypothetical protein